MLTMAPRPAVLIMAGIACLETRNIVSTLTCITRRQASGSSSTTLPRLPMPTLLSRKSRRPKRSRAAATMLRHWALSVRSAWWATAVPPSAVIMATVRSARARSRSTTSTRVPARASRIAAARPLPMPSPAAPPPAMMATLPASPASSLGLGCAELMASPGTSSCRGDEAAAIRANPARLDSSRNVWAWKRTFMQGGCPVAPAEDGPGKRRKKPTSFGRFWGFGRKRTQA